MTTATRTIDGAAVEAGDAARFQTGSVTLISAGHGIHDTYTAFLPTLLPGLIAKFALSTTQAGFLNVFLQWPSILQPFIGYVADRASLRAFIILTPGITATVMSLLGVAPGYAVLAVLLVIAGMSSAGLHAVGPVVVGYRSGRRLGQGMSFWMVGGEFGRTLGPLIVAGAVTAFGLAGTAWLLIGGWLASLALYVTLRRTAIRPAQGNQARPWRQALTAMRPVLVPLAFLLAARAFLVSALTIFLPTLMSREGAALWLAGGALSVLQAAGTVGALLGGSLSDRLGRRMILAISMAASPLLTLLFLAVQGWLRVPVLLLLGFALLSTTPVIMAIVQESFPQNRALANGIYMAVSFLLNAVTVVAVGVLGDAFGLRAAFAISAGVALIGLPLVWRLPIHFQPMPEQP
jgi:FSR family fosmidomycin resistance protein-like MFS transporter